MLTQRTVAQILESLRGYTVASLEQSLQYSREMDDFATSQGREPSDGTFAKHLEEVIRDGGRWVMKSLQLTDVRGVETSRGSSEDLDLSFVDEALAMDLTLVPYAAMGSGMSVQLTLRDESVHLSIEADERLVVAMFDVAHEALLATVPPNSAAAAQSARPFRIFIAYGGGRAWEVVRDYLVAAGFEVDAFTEQERAGELTLDVVEGMIRSASVAVIVMTGADKMEDGSIYARQNVVHETGFAQGAIGRRNTVILREAGVTLPTNVAGLTYIQFEKGEIHTTKDRVIALLSRLRSLA